MFMANIAKIRGIIYTLLIIVFIVVVATGIGLFIGVKKARLENLHTLSGFAMAILVGVHLLINYKLYINEVKSLFRK